MKDYIAYISAFILLPYIGYGKGTFIKSKFDKNSYSKVSFIPDDVSKEQFLIWSQFPCNLSAKNIPIAYNKD